jgi:hypothetical protein
VIIGKSTNYPTKDLQNKSKNRFFGGELNEIQPISSKSSKLGVSHLSLFRFPCLWPYLVNKLMQVVGENAYR